MCRNKLNREKTTNTHRYRQQQLLSASFQVPVPWALHHHHRNGASLPSPTFTIMSQDQKPQQERGYASKTSPHGSTCTTWVEDEKSWNEYQGVSVVERMENIKATLKGGLARAQAEADAQATGESSTIPNTAESKVMTETVQALQDILPADLRASLPWSALVNLMNTGLARVGWSFLGPSQSNGKEGWKVGEEAATAANSGNEAGVTLSPAAAAPASAAERLAALTEALHGVMHWLPDAALDHTATPTVDPSSLGPEKSWAEYQVCGSNEC